MGAITAEVVDTGEKRDTRGRRVTPGERRAELVAAYGRSGLTIAEFARREKVHYSTLAGWIARARRSETKGAITFAQLPWPGESAAREQLEVRFPDGTVVRGAKVADLAFAHVPVTDSQEIIPPEVRKDPDLYERIGEERTFEIDIVGPKVVKREIIRPKYRHRIERSRPPLLAPAPARVVPGGYASAGLIAWIVISKYLDHLPLYRQEKMSARWGAAISRKSMCDWVEVAAMWLEPIYWKIHRGLIEGNYLQADETPVRCNDPDYERPGTRQGYLWVISRPRSDVVFSWRESRKHDELTSLLGGFRGVLQSDAYAAYASHERRSEGVTRVGCWAHARRYFHEAIEDQPKAAHVVLRLIGRLYRLESQWDDAGVGAQRSQLRTELFARPLFWLRRIAEGLKAKVLPQSKLGKACAYLLANWDVLVAHQQHSFTRIDNNLVENAIRPSCIGKKNWLFIGHPDAGQRSAIIYSLIVSCQRHGKDPLAYLSDVLRRLPSMTNRDDLTPLTPAAWMPAS